MDITNNIVKLSDTAHIEIGNNLFIEIEGMKTIAVSLFIGVKTNYLICTIPDQFEKFKDPILNGTKLTIRFLFQEQIYHFESKVTKIMNDPVKVMVIDPPKKINILERRNTKRAPCFIPARVELENNMLDGLIRDISQHGCRCNIIIPQDLFISMRNISTLIVNLKFPGYSKDIVIKGVVANHERNGPIISVGLQFSNLDFEIKEIIEHYIIYHEKFRYQ